MNPRKTANRIRNYAIGSLIVTPVLLSPAIALLMFIATEMLTDLLMAVGASTVCAIAAGAIGLVLLRKLWRYVPSRTLKVIMQG
jgi:uncharacterized protein (DUF2062 family)